MTKVPQGFDFSFLNDEEARKILQVLERNEELQRAEKDRIRYKTNSFSLPWACVQQCPGRAGREARSFLRAPVRSLPRSNIRLECTWPGEICNEFFP